MNRHKLAYDLEVLAGALKLGGQTKDAALCRRAAKAVKAPPEVMNGSMVAEALGVADSNLPKVVGLPEPFVTLRPRGKLWLGDEIRAFAKQRERSR